MRGVVRLTRPGDAPEARRGEGGARGELLGGGLGRRGGALRDRGGRGEGSSGGGGVRRRKVVVVVPRLTGFRRATFPPRASVAVRDVAQDAAPGGGGAPGHRDERLSRGGEAWARTGAGWGVRGTATDVGGIAREQKRDAEGDARSTRARVGRRRPRRERDRARGSGKGCAPAFSSMSFSAWKLMFAKADRDCARSRAGYAAAGSAPEPPVPEGEGDGFIPRARAPRAFGEASRVSAGGFAQQLMPTEDDISSRPAMCGARVGLVVRCARSCRSATRLGRLNGRKNASSGKARRQKTRAAKPMRRSRRTPTKTEPLRLARWAASRKRPCP